MAKKGAVEKASVWVWVLRALAVVGVGVMLYLSNLHFKGAVGGESFCDLGEGLSCSEVNSSIYSEVLGVPVAFGGLGYFALVLLLSFVRKSKDLWRDMVMLTLVSLPFSLYLTLTEVFVIKSICLFCELSKVLMLVVLGLAWWRLRALKIGFEVGMVTGVVVVGVVLAAGAWFMQTQIKSGEEGNYPNLAACLTKKGVVMYGSQRCSVCGRERAVFGESFELITEIECHPREEGAQTELCFDKKVTKTPTFTIEEGEIEKGRLVGYQSPEELAEWVGCEMEYQEDVSEVSEVSP